MKKISIITIGVIILSTALYAKFNKKTSTSNKKESTNTYQNINAQTFKKLSESNNNIILDVRTLGEVNQGYIDGATTISINDREFVNKINVMQKDKAILVYCLTGSRSIYASQILIQSGFKEVYNLQGGILSWNRAGYKVSLPKKTIAKTSQGYSLETFNKELNTNSLVLVDFHAPWCAPCKKMLPIIQQVEKEYQSKTKVLKIDIQQNKDLVKKYNISSVPTFLLIKNNKILWEYKGSISKTELNKIINKHL